MFDSPPLYFFLSIAKQNNSGSSTRYCMGFAESNHDWGQKGVGGSFLRFATNNYEQVWGIGASGGDTWGKMERLTYYWYAVDNVTQFNLTTHTYYWICFLQ